MVERRFRASESASAREVGDELVLLELAAGDFFVSRGIGPRIWDLLTSGQSLDQVADCVVARYSVDRALVMADLEAFVDRAVKERLLLEEPEQTEERLHPQS